MQVAEEHRLMYTARLGGAPDAEVQIRLHGPAYSEVC
jgi:hypothetical protein